MDCQGFFSSGPLISCKIWYIIASKIPSNSIILSESGPEAGRCMMLGHIKHTHSPDVSNQFLIPHFLYMAVLHISAGTVEGHLRLTGAE